MLQLDWLRQSRHARRLGFVRSLKRQSFDVTPTAEVLEDKCVLSAISSIAVLNEAVVIEEGLADETSPSDEGLVFEKQELADCEFEVCDFLMLESEPVEESGDFTGDGTEDFGLIRYSFGMNFRGGVAEGDDSESGSDEEIDGEFASEFETADEGNPEDGEQVKVIYYFGMSGGDKGDDSEVEVTDLEAVEGYVDDVTLMQKEDYVLDDFVTFDDSGAAESGIADSAPNPILLRNLSFGGAPDLAQTTAPVVNHVSVPAAASSTGNAVLSDVSNGVVIPTTFDSNTGSSNSLFVTQNVIASAPVVLTQLNDGTRQESTDNGSERSLEQIGSTEEFGEGAESKSDKQKSSDSVDSTNELLKDETVRDADLKKVDEYLLQIGDEAQCEPQFIPATEMSAQEDQQSERNQTVITDEQNAQHRRQVTDSKIAESEQRTATIRTTQKQLSEIQHRRETAVRPESVRPV